MSFSKRPSSGGGGGGGGGSKNFAITLRGQAQAIPNLASVVIKENLTINLVRIRVGSAPTGADLIVDVHKNTHGGVTSLWNGTQANRPTVVAAATTGVSGAPDTGAACVKGDVLWIDGDQVGSTVPGGDDLWLIFECS